MATSDEKLLQFVALGREIIQRRPDAAYGADSSRVAPSPPAVRLPQPGFAGDQYADIAIINQNPGWGGKRFRDGRITVQSIAHWGDVLERWARDGTIDAYAAAYRLWAQDTGGWRVWNRWIQPMLEPAGLGREHIAYLNLVFSPTAGNKPPTDHMYEADFPLVARQIEILSPSIVIAGGKKVGDKIQEFGGFPGATLLIQNRVQNRPRVEIEAMGQQLATLLR